MIAEVDRALGRSARDVRELLDEASRVLSSLTHQLGLALAASLGHEVLSNLELAPLGERRALLVLSLGESAVRTLVLELDSALEDEELREVSAVLRERLIGRALREVRDRLEADPEIVRSSAVRIVAAAAARSWEQPIETPLFRAGAMHIAEQPEFQSGGAIGPILRVVEMGAPLDRLLVHGVEGQACARVGIDEDRALTTCSLVTFPLPGRVRAAVGILGPLRLDYARAFAAVEAVGSRLAEILDS
jgi:heat-inducible transcriptional repressor